MCCCACRRRAIPSRSSASRHRARSRHPARRLYAAARSRAPGALRRLHHRGRELAFDADHVGVLARFRRGELYDRRKVDDLREAMVSTRLFSTVSAEPVLTGETAEDGTQYVNILVRQQAGPARSLDASAGFQHGRGHPARGRLGASQPVPARRRAARRRHRRHQGAESLGPLPPQQLGPARPRLAAPARHRPARFRGLPGLYGAALRAGVAGIDADLAEALDLCLWRRAPRHQRESQRHRGHLALRRLFHRRAGRPARLRPVEQPARSHPRLPPARPGQSRSLAARRRRFLHPQPDRRQRLLSGRRAVRRRRPRPLRLDLRHRPRRSRAVAAALCGRRRLGARLRLPGIGAARPQQRPARRAQPRRIRARGPLPLRQLRRGRLRRRRPGLRGPISDLRFDALRSRHRRARLYQFRPGPGRRRDPDRAAAGRDR